MPSLHKHKAFLKSVKMKWLINKTVFKETEKEICLQANKWKKDICKYVYSMHLVCGVGVSRRTGRGFRKEEHTPA